MSTLLPTPHPRLWFTGLSFSLRLLHNALLFPGTTLRSVPCLSLYSLLSSMHLSSTETCLLLLFSAVQLLSAHFERTGLKRARLCPSTGGSLAQFTFFCSFFLKTELSVKRGKMVFHHMISDSFKEVYLAQTAPRASHLSKQGPAAICRMMLLLRPRVCCRFLKNHLLHHLFS